MTEPANPGAQTFEQPKKSIPKTCGHAYNASIWPSRPFAQAERAFADGWNAASAAQSQRIAELEAERDEARRELEALKSKHAAQLEAAVADMRVEAAKRARDYPEGESYICNDIADSIMCAPIRTDALDVMIAAAIYKHVEEIASNIIHQSSTYKEVVAYISHEEVITRAALDAAEGKP